MKTEHFKGEFNHPKTGPFTIWTLSTIQKPDMYGFRIPTVLCVTLKFVFKFEAPSLDFEIC